MDKQPAAAPVSSLQRFGGILTPSTVDRPGFAATLMVIALAMLSLQDGFVKLTSSDVSLWQFQMLRAIVSLSLLVLLSCFVSSGGFKPKRLWAVVLRSALLATAMIFLFGGAPFLTLAEMGAGLYVFPLFVAVLSAVVLRERVGPRRIMAILAGFIGTLLILKPGTEAFRLIGLLPVCAALTFACNILCTRKLCREESPVTLSFGSMGAMFITGIIGTAVFTLIGPTSWAEAQPYLATGWHSLSLWIIGLVALCGSLQVTANLLLTTAYQNAESSWLAPFDYSYLVFVTIWGVVIWGDFPDNLTFIGMALIASAGCYVAWRERQESKGSPKA